MSYFIIESGERKGPFDIENLKKQSLSRNTLIWKQGFPEWLKLENVSELAEIVDLIPPDIPSENVSASATHTKTVIVNNTNIMLEDKIQKITLLLITLFLGGFGIHKVYTKNYGWVVVYIIGSILFFPYGGLVGLVEFIRYATLEESEIQKQYEEKKNEPFGFIW